MTVHREAHATDFIAPQMQEAVKTYTAFDVSNRPVSRYVAMVDAKHGDRCQLTSYAYDGVSTRIAKTKEGLSLWNSAWDI